MSQKYYTLLTTKGAALLANATALGTPLKLTHMAVGDANGSIPQPVATQTKLVNEVRRAAINTLFIDENNPNQIIAEQVIPETEGGWFIHEIGLFDDKGNLIAVGNCPSTYKPQLVEGSGRTQVIRMIIIVDNVDSVEIKIDPSVVLATRQYVDNALTAHVKSTDHPDATTKSKGFVQLSSTTDSNSETTAATSKAIKTTYDIAAKDASTKEKGRVKLNSATDSTSETEAATPKAVSDVKNSLGNYVKKSGDTIENYVIVHGDNASVQLENVAGQIMSKHILPDGNIVFTYKNKEGSWVDKLIYDPVKNEWRFVNVDDIKVNGSSLLPANIKTDANGFPILNENGKPTYEVGVDVNCTKRPKYNNSSLVALSDFAAGYSTNDYIKLPTGHILQWCVVQAFSTHLAMTFNLPIAFPNVGLHAWAVHDDPFATDNGVGFSSASVDKTKVYVRTAKFNTDGKILTSAVGLRILAIGY